MLYEWSGALIHFLIVIGSCLSLCCPCFFSGFILLFSFFCIVHVLVYGVASLRGFFCLDFAVEFPLLSLSLSLTAFSRLSRVFVLLAWCLLSLLIVFSLFMRSCSSRSFVNCFCVLRFHAFSFLRYTFSNRSTPSTFL